MDAGGSLESTWRLEPLPLNLPGEEEEASNDSLDFSTIGNTIDK